MVFVPVPTALRRSGLAAACGALLALGPITAVAAPTAPADGGELRAPVHAPTSPTGRWFVSLDDGSPVGTGAAAPADSAAAAAAVDGFVEQVADLPDEVARTARIVDTHEDLWTGAVVEAPDSAIDAVAALPGVTAVHPVLTTAVPTEVTATSPASVPGGDAAGAGTAGTGPAGTGLAGTEPAGTEPAARTGRGVRVAVIDTGVDLDHPAFGGTGVNGTTPFPNDVVVGGWDFVGDAYNENPVLGSEYDASARPDARPDDCNGHGTHVAGLLAGRDGDPRFTGGPGVAAEAQLLAYRVFGDADGRMNLSLADTGGGLLLVSQFTLAADTGSGMRPGFSTAAPPQQAEPVFNQLLEHCRGLHGGGVATGRFGAHMVISLVNDGPVTFLLRA